MILHDGSSMPYLEYITENLHFYIDEILECIIDTMKTGVKNNNTAFSIARIKEAQKQTILKTSKSEKRHLTDDEFYQVIFS